MSIQLTQLEDDHTKLELQSSAALLSSQSELAAVKMQLQQSQDAGAAMSLSLAALQEQARQSRLGSSAQLWKVVPTAPHPPFPWNSNIW